MSALASSCPARPFGAARLAMQSLTPVTTQKFALAPREKDFDVSSFP